MGSHDMAIHRRQLRRESSRHGYHTVPSLDLDQRKLRNRTILPHVLSRYEYKAMHATQDDKIQQDTVLELGPAFLSGATFVLIAVVFGLILISNFGYYSTDDVHLICSAQPIGRICRLVSPRWPVRPSGSNEIGKPCWPGCC